MKGNSELAVTAGAAVCVAAYAATAIGFIAHYELGFSSEAIRSSALVLAIILATLVAIDFFGKKARRAK
jgi:hypothetical protein